mmetsp:Transcript_101044/g.253387  ORF Transcript_101044/g.253387 Transcript_101044/m.253387 type:complete len:248 (+) Transcript_101044:217-960(+)
MTGAPPSRSRALQKFLHAEFYLKRPLRRIAVFPLGEGFLPRMCLPQQRGPFTAVAARAHRSRLLGLISAGLLLGSLGQREGLRGLHAAHHGCGDKVEDHGPSQLNFWGELLPQALLQGASQPLRQEAKVLLPDPVRAVARAQPHQTGHQALRVVQTDDGTPNHVCDLGVELGSHRRPAAGGGRGICGPIPILLAHLWWEQGQGLRVLLEELAEQDLTEAGCAELLDACPAPLDGIRFLCRRYCAAAI